MTALEQQLAELPGMSPAQLRAKWRDCWRKPAPDIGPDLLRRGIAWKLQSRVHGDLPSHIKRELERAADRLRRGEELISSSRPSLKPGTRLVRQWQGRVHHVLVLDDGYEYDGRRFSSLTPDRHGDHGHPLVRPDLLRPEEAEVRKASWLMR